jgi:Zn-finger nucleic acid-binding protein
MKECKCGNYKPYSDTIEDSVIYAPTMPLDACVNCSGVRYDLTALQKENDELILRNKYNRDAFDEMEAHYKKENDELRLALGIAESFPLKVRMECRKLIKSGDFSRDFISMLHDAANAALSKTPAH